MSGKTTPIAMLLGSRRICRVSLSVRARIRRSFAAQAVHDGFPVGFARLLGARLEDNGDEGVLHGRGVARLRRGPGAELRRACPGPAPSAVVEDRGPVAVLGLGHEMRGHDHRHPAGGKHRDPLPELAAGEGVGAAGRLVEEKDLGPVKEGGSHGQALLEALRAAARSAGARRARA
jgi:hypothetical protein